MKKKNKNTLSKRSVVLIIAVMTVFILAAFAFNVASYRPARDAGAGIDRGSEKYNILLIGRDNAAKLADVIMLASVDARENSVRVLQIPRDTYFNYTDRDYKKINGALSACGGAKGFSERLSESLGVPIDHYVSLDLDAFVEIIDIMGGVEVRVPCDMEYSDPYQDLTVRLEKGDRILDGETAMQFIRFRSGYIRGDISRMDAQKIFLASAANKMMKIRNPIALYNILKAVSDKVETDLSDKDVLYFAYHLMKCENKDISFVTLPGEDVRSESSGAWYYILSRSAVQELLGTENFDKNANFVDKRVKSFYDIYDRYYSYKIYRSDDILNGNLELR